MTALEQLEAAREWLSDADHWTTGAFGVDDAGRIVDPTRAARTCATGALVRFGCEPGGTAYNTLCLALGTLSVCQANDTKGYDFIMAGFDRAIAAERERQS